MLSALLTFLPHMTVAQNIAVVREEVAAAGWSRAKNLIVDKLLTLINTT